MSKYEKLWEYVVIQNEEELLLSFEKIEEILTFPIDHSFLGYKKELLPLGFEVKKISMKEKTVRFMKKGGQNNGFQA